MQWSHELGDLLTFPWRESAKPLGHWAAVANVGYCVFCVVALCSLIATLQTMSTV